MMLIISTRLGFPDLISGVHEKKYMLGEPGLIHDVNQEVASAGWVWPNQRCQSKCKLSFHVPGLICGVNQTAGKSGWARPNYCCHETLL